MMVSEYLQAARSETETKMEEILDNARNQAAQIVLDAREDAEEELKRGFRQGFEEGSEEGKRSFDEKTEAKIREDDETLKRLLDEIYEERERTYSALESEVTNLAVEIVRKIINPAEDELENVYMSLIKNALRQMPTEGKVVLRVGPKEYERFFASGAARIELDSGATVTASVLRDVTLNDGDCIIDTDDVTINAGIDQQLQYVKLAFERANQYEPD
jgi:flagellar assembly protein FliH